MSFINIILVLALTIYTALAGNVKFINFQTDYSNIGLAQRFFFTFQLDNNLPTTGYMQIQLPFQLSTIPTAQYYITNPSTCQSSQLPLPTQTVTIQGTAATTSVYWINYPSILSNQNVYTLILTLSAPVTNTIFSNAAIQFRPVSIITYASIDMANPQKLLVYDSNPVFTMINFESQIANSLNTLVLSGGTGNLQASNILVVRLTPTQTQIRRVVISLPQAVGIQFDSTNSVTFCQVATLVLNQDFTCQETNSNEVLLTFTSDLTNQNYDISLKINFPTFQDISNIQVVGKRAGDNVVMEWNTISNGVSTTIPNWISRGVFGFQNQPLSSSVCVYRQYAATDYFTYNTLRFTFAVSANMLTAINYKLTMNLQSDATILTNSIVTTNLPNYSATLKISCTTTTSNQVVQCINVGALQTGVTYSITLRASFVYDNTATQTQFKANFGQLAIYPLLASGSYYTLPSVSMESAATLTALVSGACIQNNNNWLNQLNPANIYDYQVVHTRSDNSIATTIDLTGSFGVKQMLNQYMQFYLELTNTDFSGAPTLNSQLQVQVNYRIIAPQAASTCLPLANNFVCSFTAPAPASPYQIGVFKFGYVNTVTAASFVSGTGVVISFDAVDVTQLSTVTPSANFNTDYIFTIIPDITNPTNNVKTTLVNSFVVPSSLYTDINISVVNFWTGTSNGNDANLVPTFIRVNVFFSSNQPAISNGNWIVFFDNVNFLPDATTPTNPSCSITQTSTTCGYQGGNANSYHYLFQNYFTFTSTISSMPTIATSFTVIIPVSTVVNKNSVRIRTALLDTSGNLQGLSSQFQFQFAAAGVTQQATIQDYNASQNTGFEGINFLMNVGSYLVGQSVSSVSMNAAVGDSFKIFSPNTNANQGAGVTVTSIHNIVSSSTFDVQDGGYNLISSTPYQKCIKFGYNFNDGTGRYGFYCPLKAMCGFSTITSFLNLINISLPWEGGTSIPNIVTAFSNNIVSPPTGYNVAGLLLKYTTDNTLNAMQPNVLSSVTMDIDLPISQRFTKLQVTFTTTNQLPASFNFVITSALQASDPFLFTVNQLVLCQLYKSSGGVFTHANLPKGTYKIRIGGINIVDNPVMRQNAYFETQTISGQTIDKTSSAQQIYYNFNQNQMSFAISNQSFLIPNKYAMSVFTFTFTVTGRSIYQDEYILLNLDAFSVDNSITTPVCKVFITTTTIVSPLWSDCYFNGSFKQLIITPLNDIIVTSSSTLSFDVQIQNIRVPRTPVLNYFINGGLYNAQDSTQPILYQQNIALPTRQNEQTIQYFTQLVLQSKTFNTVGSLAQLQFSIKPSVSNLSFNSMILIYLPSYYPSVADYADPVCYIQLIDVNTPQPSTFTRCEYLQDRIIAVRDISTTLVVGYAYHVTVNGVAQPLFTVPQTIFVALIQDYSNISTTVNEYLEVTDVIPSTPSANILRVSNFSKQQSTWIVQDNYVFTFRVASAVTANSYITIDFPSEWVDKNQNKPAISCSLQLAASANSPFTCVQQGFRIYGQLTGGLTANTDYTLKLSGFSNPHYSLCIGQGVVLSISDSNQLAVSQRSYLTIMNIGPLVFDQGLYSNLIFKWQEVLNDVVQDGETTLTPIPPLVTLYIGTYTRVLRLSVADGNRISKDLSMKLSQTVSGQTPFQTYPSLISMTVGDYYVDIRIGASTTVTPGIYSIYFNLVNGGSYNIPPLIKVQIASTPYTIPNPSVTNIVVPIDGYSLPIYWNLDAAVPINSIQIETDIAISPDLVLDYKAYSDMTFQIKRQSDFIELKSDGTPIVSSTASTVLVSLNTADSTYYSLTSNTVGITLVNSDSSVPQTAITLQSSSCTSVTYTMSSNQLVYVYYQIQLQSSSLAFNYASIIESVRVLTQYQFDDVNQVQYGVFPIYQTITNYEFTIPNLFSQRNYIVKFFPVNLMLVQGAVQSFNLSPQSNLDYLIKTRVLTNAILTHKHLTYLACQHSYTFLYPYQRVRSIYEDICDPTLTAASLPSVQTSPVSLTYFFYLYPFEYIEVVEQLGTIYDSANLKNNIIAPYKTIFTNLFTTLGLPVLNDYQYGGKVVIYPPVFVSSGQTTATKTSLTVTGITLQNNGIIFAILEKLAISIKGRVVYVTNPTFLQVRAGLNSTGLVALGQASAVYEGTPITFFFDNLTPASHYRVVMYATSEDPSAYKLITTNVTSVEQTLPAYSAVLSAFNILFVFVLLLILG